MHSPPITKTLESLNKNCTEALLSKVYSSNATSITDSTKYYSESNCKSNSSDELLAANILKTFIDDIN